MLRKCLVLIAVLTVVAMSTAVATSFTGSLSSPAASGLTGTGFWPDPNATSIVWTVTQVTGGWLYDYTLSVPKADISHFILETSESFTESDITKLDVIQGTAQSYSVGMFFAPPLSNPSQQPNPFMPDDIYGIKLDSTTGTTLQFQLTTPRAPVWGDFYAKCGNVGGTQNTIWNVGLTNPDSDPTTPASNGSQQFHILVPDTVNIVPEPSSIIMGTMGMLGMLPMMRRRSRK